MKFQRLSHPIADELTRLSRSDNRDDVLRAHNAWIALHFPGKDLRIEHTDDERIVVTVDGVVWTMDIGGDDDQYYFFNENHEIYNREFPLLGD